MLLDYWRHETAFRFPARSFGAREAVRFGGTRAVGRGSGPSWWNRMESIDGGFSCMLQLMSRQTAEYRILGTGFERAFKVNVFMVNSLGEEVVVTVVISVCSFLRTWQETNAAPRTREEEAMAEL